MMKIILMAFSLILAFNFSAFAQKTDCTKTTDDEIIAAIYNKIKVKYADQIKHINIRAKDGVVTIEGWVTTEKIKKEIGKYAKKIKCVKQVINDLVLGKSGGCGPGQKECGEICISEKETCNICLRGGSCP